MLRNERLRAFGSHRGAVLVLLTVSLVALASSSALHAGLMEVFAGSREIIAKYPVLGPAMFVLFAALSGMLAFVSSAFLLPVAVFNWGEPLTIVLLWTGWLMGGACSYAIGRFLGQPIVRRLSTGRMLRRMEGFVGSRSPFGMILLFQLALPSEIPGYVLGLARYSFPKYMLGLGIVELTHTVALVHLGASFVEQRVGSLVAVGLALALFSIIALYLLRRRLRGHVARSVDEASAER